MKGPKPKIICAPGPGQNPEDVANLKPVKDWPPAGYAQRVPQAVFISVVPDVFQMFDTASVRTDFRSTTWRYPNGGFGRVQSNFEAVPYANFGIGQSFDGGIAGTGFGSLAPGNLPQLFPEVFDVVYNTSQPDRIPVRYNFGSVHGPEPAWYRNTLAMAYAVKAKIEKARKGLTFVSVIPWSPPNLAWGTTEFQENWPIEILHPGQNININALTDEPTWADAFQASKFGQAINAPQGLPPDRWFTITAGPTGGILNPGPFLQPPIYDLNFVDWGRSDNQIGFSYQGPSELLWPTPFPKHSPFFGCDVLHIHIGHRGYANGPSVPDLLLSTLAVGDVEGIAAGHSIDDCAASSVNGFEQHLASRAPYATQDILNDMKAWQHNYRGHTTQIYGPPLNTGWSNDLAFRDISTLEQYWYWSGGVVHGGMNPNLINPSFFNYGHPDERILGEITLMFPNNDVGLPMDYPIEERFPTWGYYNHPSGNLGPYSLLEWIQLATNKMKMYYSPLRTAWADSWWRAQFRKFEEGYATAGVTYHGPSDGLTQEVVIDAIAARFGFSL